MNLNYFSKVMHDITHYIYLLEVYCTLYYITLEDVMHYKVLHITITPGLPLTYVAELTL